jgi:hypothetical protein
MSEFDLLGELNRLAGTTGLGFSAACNVYAGTTALEGVGALNVKAGTSGLDLEGVLNRLAGTSGRGALAAARLIYRTNLAAYPSFESGTTGWGVNANATLGTSSAWSYAGTQCLTLTSVAAGNASAKTASEIAVTGSVSYAFSMRGRSAVSSRLARLQVSWYTSADALITTDTGSNVTTSTSADVTATVVATSPSNAAKAIVFLVVLSTAAGGEVHYFDALLIEQASTVGNYFDGSFPNCRWTGAANASTSRNY